MTRQEFVDQLIENGINPDIVLTYLLNKLLGIYAS